MKGFLQTALSTLALVVVLSAIGLSIEWYRRRSLQRLALEKGGTFEAGGILDGAEVPEAKAFDGPASKATYHNVTRIVRSEASYVLAQGEYRWKGFRDEQKSVSYVVCFITLPGPELPSVSVSFPARAFLLGPMLGVPDPPPPLKVAEATPAFAEHFEVRPLKSSGATSADAIARLLPKGIQDEMVASRALVSGFQVRGSVVRLEAVSQETGYPHRDVFSCAGRLVAAWSANR
jgi:hypothetical protein